MLSGADAFKLYDTFGFPVDLTKEIVGEKGITVDEEEFTRLMEEQRSPRERENRKAGGGWSHEAADLISDVAKTQFAGYDSTECTAKVEAILVDGVRTQSATEGEFTMLCDKTVFYGEGGGQVGDTGTLTLSKRQYRIIRHKEVSTESVLHMCEFEGNAVLNVGDTVTIKSTRQDARQ